MLVKKIHKRKDYVDISKTGLKLNTKNFIIQYRKLKKQNETALVNNIKMGIVASKKIGNAVKRNYVKRIIRVISKSSYYVINKNIEFVIIGKRSVISESFKKLNLEMKSIFKEISK